MALAWLQPLWCTPRASWPSMWPGVLVGSAGASPPQVGDRVRREGLAWAAQIGLFVMLGLLAQPEKAVTSLVPGGGGPAPHWSCSRDRCRRWCPSPSRVPGRWVAFVSVAGLRGAVPIVFAAIPLGLGSRARVWCSTRLWSSWWHSPCRPAAAWAGRRLGVDVRVEGDRAAGQGVGPMDHGRVVVGGGRR